jgi:glycosyltransferase involved in cell wall biosynthesis
MKNILLVIDIYGWCFDNISKIIKRYLGKKYKIYIEHCFTGENYITKYSQVKFDLIIKFWYGWNEYYDPFLQFSYARKAICIYDYLYWNKEIIKRPNPCLMNKFYGNINNADAILYSCPKIKELLEKNFKDIISNKKMIHIYDGVSTELFYPKEYLPQRDKLVVGWVGNSEVFHKKFHVLKAIVRGVEWIKFVSQKSDNPISHDKMVDFYHNIDVLVCVSDCEGTPNPILEASASGRAWISTDVGIVRILYNSSSDDIKPGFIVSDKSEILDKLKFLHINRDIMSKMGEMGRNCIEKNFDWKNRVKQFDFAINELTKC